MSRATLGSRLAFTSGASYSSTTITAPPAGTLLAFTDGLVERRGEALDRGLARLRGAATASDGSLGELLARLVSELRHGPSDDDIAIVGVRWKA